jgi:hypothetical protein
MRWEAIDQYGAQRVGFSEAQTREELMEEIRDLVDEMVARSPAGCGFIVEPFSGQIMSPNTFMPERIFRSPWAAEQDDPAALFREILEELQDEHPGGVMRVEGV